MGGGTSSSKRNAQPASSAYATTPPPSAAPSPAAQVEQGPGQQQRLAPVAAVPAAAKFSVVEAANAEPLATPAPAEQGEDEWDDWDESRWKDSEDRRGMEESAGMDATSKDHNAGFVDVSSTPRMTKNVVSSGQPRVEYSIPALGENVPYEVIPSDTKKSRFYLSVPSGSQQFGALTVKEMALEGAETGVPPTKTSLVGKITSGGSVAEGEANLFFDVEYNCQHAGVSAVLVVIPMEPSEYGSISFRLVKVCGGYKRTYNTAYSMSELLPRLMVLIGLCVISVFGFRFVSRKISEGKTRSRGGAYSQVSQQGARGVI